jgi:DNA-binding GntR family transcriptional regulator
VAYGLTVSVVIYYIWQPMTSHLFPVPPSDRTKSQLAYDLIRQAIQASAFEPRERIVIDGLAQDLGMSAIPVREALKRLVAEGMLQSEPHRGFFVPRLSSDDLTDIYETLEVLEPMAARLAAPHFTEDRLDLSERILAEMVVAESDPPTWLAKNLEFHMSLYEPSRRPRLIRTIGQLVAETAREVLKGDFFLDFLPRSDREHAQMIEYLREGEVEQMASLLQSHIRQGLGELLAQKARAEGAAATEKGGPSEGERDEQ